MAAPPTMIGRVLGHYRVLEQIGAGGMGVVFRARDEHLQRDVALKVLPPNALSEDDSRRRFRREAETLSRLNHPNIQIVHDFDVQDGIDFLVGELIPGLGLDEILHSGPLPVRDVLDFGRQLAEAVAAAHAAGVLHRDLKPSNLRVTPERRLKVLDFGLARAAPSAQDAEEMTRSFAIAGTLPYMAPEQLSGGRVDERSDLWAVGVVLYELATGKHPFASSSDSGTAAAILSSVPAAPTQVRRNLPPGLDAVLLKCLEKDPENRYQSAKEILVDLRRLSLPPSATAVAFPPRRSRRRLWAGIAAAALLLAIATYFVLPRLQQAAPAPQIRSLAVLPLSDLSAQAGQEYFADGMTEALIAELAKIRGVKVISRTSVMQYKNARRALPQIARELGVDGVVEGSIVREGQRLRITVQLIHGPTDEHLWADSYERELSGVLALQGEMARAIAQQIQVTLTPQEQQHLSSARPVDPAAYEAYLKGRYYWNLRTQSDLLKATEHFQAAIGLDPTYALAYAGLGDSYALYAFYNVLPAREAFPKARAAAHQALKLDPNLIEAHTLLAFITFFHDWDWASAEAQLRRILEQRPDYGIARQWYAEFLASMGRHEEALAQIRLAQQSDPLSPIMKAVEGLNLYYAGQYDAALEACNRTLAMSPGFEVAYVYRAYIRDVRGEYDRGIAELRGLPDLEQFPARMLVLARLYAQAGNTAEARRLLQRALRLDPDAQRLLTTRIAYVYAALGDRESAVQWFHRAYEERSVAMVRILVDPDYRSLLPDPRFEALLRRMNFPAAPHPARR